MAARGVYTLIICAERGILISWAVLMCVPQHPLSYTTSAITGTKNVLQGDKDEALWHGRNFHLKMWHALSCWYQQYVTWGSMTLTPPSGVLGSQHSTCNMQYHINLQFRYTIQWKINHLKSAWYHHNLWMPLQWRLSQTWNNGAKIKTQSFSCTKTLESTRSAGNVTTCAVWVLGNHWNQHHLNLEIYFLPKTHCIE
jgi:hypothetical protein